MLNHRMATGDARLTLGGIGSGNTSARRSWPCSCQSRRNGRDQVPSTSRCRFTFRFPSRCLNNVGMRVAERMTERRWSIGPAQFGIEARPEAEAKPSQVCRLPAQHHPSFGALRLSGPSRPVPLLIHSAGVRASSEPLALRRRDPIAMKQWPRARTSGCCNSPPIS